MLRISSTAYSEDTVAMQLKDCQSFSNVVQLTSECKLLNTSLKGKRTASAMRLLHLPDPSTHLSKVHSIKGCLTSSNASAKIKTVPKYHLFVQHGGTNCTVCQGNTGREKTIERKMRRGASMFCICRLQSSRADCPKLPCPCLFK